MKLKVLFYLLSFLLSGAVFADEANIPLESIRMPGDDLIYQGRLLTPEEAFELSETVDLSKLSPSESEVWKDRIIHNSDPLQDELPVKDGERIKFSATIASPSGLFRFNASTFTDENRTYTLMLDKTLHTTLLKKNLLRKLGFIVPKMKYLKTVTLVFSNFDQKVDFIKRKIPEGTFGAPSRWIDKKELENYETDKDNLEITLKDVAILRPEEKDHFNFAIGVPPRVLTSRITRSLIIPYALADIGESVNKVNWFVGREKNKEIILPHNTFGIFHTTMDDANWMMDRLEKLTSQDIDEAVAQAFFPKPVELLLQEKIKARRNSLFQLFKRNTKEFDYNAKISDGTGVLDSGKITKEDWPAYAARFAHGSPDSPFQDFQYFIFSKLQSASFDNILGKINEFIRYSPISERRSDFARGQFQEGLDHFVETGEFIDFPVTTWFAPTISGGLIANRDIVIGSYMGTDNLVQLADTFGVTFNLGGHLGIENLPIANSGGFLRAGVSLVKTWTHLKPVKTLKSSFKEPYKNIIVPLIKLNLKRHVQCLAEFKEGELSKNCNEYLEEIEAEETDDSASTDTEETTDIDEDALPEEEDDEVSEEERLKKKLLGKMMAHINESLGVGESIIITEKIVPNVNLKVNAGHLHWKIGVGVGSEVVVVRRLHLYRKDADHIQIYDDNGKALGFSMNFSLDSYIPVLNLRTKTLKGKYDVIVHTININPKLDANPKLFENAQALYYLLNEGSTELLEANANPHKITNNFKDKSVKMSFLVWRAKYLKGNSLFAVEDPKGRSGKYLSVKDESQSGVNYEKFAKDIINFYLAKLYDGISWGGSDWTNPAHTFKGVSASRLARFESKLVGDEESEIDELKIKGPFVSLTDRKEGWSMSNKKLKSMIGEINKKYGRVMFDKHAFEDAKRLKLYDISMNTNIYERGFENIKKTTPALLEKFQRVYKKERQFTAGCDPRLRSNIKRGLTVACGHLEPLISDLKSCIKLEKKDKKAKEKASCWLSFTKKLEEALKFEHFLRLVGEKNVFIYGSISGFRHESEILADPIDSHTIGKIGSRYWNGPVDAVRAVIGVQKGEFEGSWIRESL
ncbi:MAG: hypothetical protein ACJAT2_000858 [Bacteriovoracaceae bacterium]|jgi:hypothetical protein